MAKKVKYTPGWQQRRVAEDRQVQQNTKDLLDAYYTKQEIENAIEREKQKSIKQPTAERDIPAQETPAAEDKVQDQAVEETKPLRGLSYNAESPEDYMTRTSDPLAFQDAIAPSILDPNYDEWASRQDWRAQRGEIFDGKSKTERSATDRQAIAASERNRLFRKDDYQYNKESPLDRLNRRIKENQTFGTVSKNKALTDKEAGEILTYRLMVDPLLSSEQMKGLRQQIDKMQAEDSDKDETVVQPNDYFGTDAQNKVGAGGTFNLGLKLLQLANSAWSKSFLSDFIERSNESQMKVSIGQIQRSKELTDLSSYTKENIDQIEKYVNNLAQLQRFNKEIGRGRVQDLSPQKQEWYAKLLEENAIIRQSLDESNWWLNANRLASWAPGGIGGKIAGKIDSWIDDDLGGVRNGLSGLDSKLDNLNELLRSTDYSEGWLEEATKSIGEIKQQLTSFDVNVAEKQERWREQALTDAQDIVDWKTGDNWMNMHSEVDPYYKQQKKLLEQSEFDWSDPVKMAQFGWSGIAGGSNSSWWKSIIGTTAKVGGAIGGAVTSGGTSVAIQAGAIATAFEADKSAGSDENNIESEDKTSSSLRSKLSASGKYDDFIAEGLEQLKNTDVAKKLKERSYTAEDGTLVKTYGDDDTHYNKDVIKKVLQNKKDREELQDFIMDMYLAGMWHSKDPEITKMHADAIIGTNNQFYNNQPVNTADAAIGAVVDVANLQPVKYLAKSVKVTKDLVGRSIGKTALGLKYQGFKEGVHNVTNRIADSQIAQLTKAGIIKTGSVLSKTPTGAVYGGISGAIGGAYLSDGSIYGTAGGAVAGAAAGTVLHKAPTWLGIEDKIANAYNATRAFTYKVPSAWMYASSIGKTSANITARMFADTASEMAQEGVQALNQREKDYDVQFNRPTLTRVFEDMMLGAKAAYIWANQNDPEMKSESEVYSQMNATPLLTLFGPGTAQTVMQIRGGVKDIDMVSAVLNNIDAERRGNIAELEQGREYARHTSKEDKKEMLNKFENFKRLAGKYADAKKKLNAGLSEQQLMEGDRHYIPSELIDEQIKDYEDIYTLANSSLGRVIGQRANAKPGTDRYAQAISEYNFLKKKRTEAFNALAEKNAEQNAVLGQDAVESFVQEKQAEKQRTVGNFQEEFQETMSANPEEKTIAENIAEKNDLAKMLVHAATLMQIVEDYSALQEISGIDDIFLNRSKVRLSEIKKTLKSHGFDVQTVDDVVNTLNMSEEGDILKALIDRSRSKDDPFVGSMEDYLDAYSSMLRERELLEFDFLWQDEILSDYMQHPSEYIDKWDKRLSSDKQLEAIIEDDWVNTLRDYESAAAREVKDNDIYVGNDGYWYITKKVGDNFEKHRYHPNSRKIDPEALLFDPIEYDQAKKSEDTIANKREANKKANDNIQTGSVEPQQEVQEEPVAEVVEPQPEESAQLFSVGDYVNTGSAVGQIIDIDEDGNITISYGSGRPVENKVDPTLLTKISSPIQPSKYSQGDTIRTADGKSYTVTDVYLEEIDQDTLIPKYSYNLLDNESGEVLAGQSSDKLDELSKIPMESTTGSTVQPNEAQQEVINILDEKRKADARDTQLSDGTKRRTGHDYLIKIKNRIQRFTRVHGILDNIFDESEDQKIKRRVYSHELSKLFDESKDKFSARVIELQDEYNKKIEEKYGKDSDEYKYYSINLTYYLKGNILNDRGIIDAISSILSQEQLGPQVVIGSIIDEIARDFFDPNKTLENKKEYKMSDSVFNSIVSQLNELQNRFNELEWVVDTNSYTWFGEFNNGIKMAGETDLIAIDRSGNIHILDFKTTADLNKYDTVLEYKTTDLEGNEIWMPISPENVPEGAETRVSSSFIDDLATRRGETGKRTYAAQYARQLEAYRLLIQQQTGRNVASLEVIPFAVDYDTKDNVATHINSVKVYNFVNLSKVPQLQSDINEIDNFLTKATKSLTKEEISATIDDIKDRISEARLVLDKEGVSADTRVKVLETIEKLNATIAKLQAIEDDKIKLADDVYTKGLLSNRDEYVKDLTYQLQKADNEISEYEKQKNGPKDDGKGADTEDPNRSWLWNEPEEVIDDDKKHWWQFNNLHSYLSAIKNIPNYLKNNIKSDFITNSTFVITRDDKNDLDVFSVTIEYRGLKIGPIKIRIGNEAPEQMRNYDTVMDKYLSAMGRNFFRQYYQLAKTLKPGERIVATRVERTNGTIKYSGKNKNLQDTKFLSKNDPRLLQLINGEDSLIGVSDGDVVIEVGSGNRQTIWSPQMDQDGVLISKKIREKVLPGNQDSESIPDGVVIFLHKFRNEEDPEGEYRTVPLVLQGKNLGDPNKENSRSKDSETIVKILLDIANSKSPKKTEDELYQVQAVNKDGSTRMTTVPGLTNSKVLKLLVRFGAQAEFANDEFIFDFLRTDDGTRVSTRKKIVITDMRVDATEDQNGILHRPTVTLDLRKQEDINQLYEILARTQMHINQMGTMRANLNTADESSPFGALRTFFLDESNENVKTIKLNTITQIDQDDVFADESDPTKGLTGIGWAIKHGYALTNAEDLENPIISIHELGKENTSQKNTRKKQENKKSEKQQKPKTKKDEPTVSSTQNEPEPEQPSEPEDLGITDDILAKATEMLDSLDEDDIELPGAGRMVTEDLLPTPITEEEKKQIEKRLYRLVGKVAVKWTKGAIDVLKCGAQVAGRTAVNAIELSDRLPKGTEFHEAFHKILEVLIPNKQRIKMYELYKNTHNEQFKKANGRDLTDRDISEDLAEMFRLWMLNKQEVKLHWNILKTFKELKAYIDQLKELGDYRFAALFMLANSGIFRYAKPDQENVKHFLDVLGGSSDMVITAKNSEGNLVKLNLDQFPAFGGRSLFNDAINGIIFALFNGYSIDMLASNAAKLKTSRQDISNLFRGKETTKNSAWFRVLTGEYTTSDEKFTMQDAYTYYRLYKQSDEIKMIAAKIIKSNPNITDKDFKVRLIASIYKQELSRKPEDLNTNQKMMAQLFNEDTWWMVEKKINNKLHKMAIDSERATEDDYIEKMDTADDDTDEESLISKDVGDHKDEFFDHARTDDATAAIRFFLSSIPDERFATQEDVDNKLVRSTRKKDGSPVTISNSTNLLGYQSFLSMKIVSNKLLLACHNVNSVQELDQKLQSLAETDPIFYRIAKKYHNALQNETLKHTDGKNKITKNGRYIPSEMYEQGQDELGWYYTWNDAGENPGQRIEGVVTQTNPDMESFVTQLFNYVACQKLDFIMVTLQQELDEDGEAIEGSYTATVRSSDSDYAASVYPRSWFARFRSGVNGIFHITNGNKYRFSEGGKEKLYDAIDTLNKVQKAFSAQGAINIHDRVLDKNDEDGFREIEYEFIKALNTLGINITKEALEYYLQESFGRDISVRRAFGILISRKEQDTSFSKFLDDIKDLKSRIKDGGDNSVLSQDRDEEVTGFGRNATKTKRSGSYIYSASGFVNWMARAVSRYNKAAVEIMTNGPEGTKRYMLAQSHTASDITDDFNRAVIEGDGIKGSKMLRDMSKYIYNTIKGVRGIPKGSLIIKQLYFAADKKLHLVLHTHGGVKVDSNHDGGVSYRKITEREDWLAKAAILKQGGVIFPTLSDKSTWFYLTGVAVPGINYSELSQMPSNQMLHIGLHDNQKASSSEAHIKFDFSLPNTQLDQMIEYAECERAAIEREINRGKKGTVWENLKKLPFIEFFDDNRKRFGGLSEIVYVKPDGTTDLMLINNYDETPEQCLAKADQYFFNKTMKEKRQIMALTLEEGFLRNMAMLERAGLISASNNLEEQILDEQGNPTGKSRKQNRLMQYKNVGLDSEVIRNLKALYLQETATPGKNVSVEQSQRAESQAICAYVWDIYLRGVISNEETERMYTGQPQFFKWKHNKIVDATSGKIMNVLTDRHSDQSKRLGGLGSTGDRNRTDLANQRRTYKCAEVEDQIVESKMYDALKNSFIDNYVRDAYQHYKEQEIRNDSNLTEEQKTEKLDALDDLIYGENKKNISEIEKEFKDADMYSAYTSAVASAENDASAYSGDINVADGAAYIRPEMAKALLRQRGRFTSKVKEAFDLLEGKRGEDNKMINPLTNKEAYLIINDALIGAQKYSAYGYRVNDSTGDIPIHYYDKFALFVIFPHFATGFTSDILAKMEEQKIDMLMMHSAVKTGSQEASQCTPEMFNTPEEFKQFKFNTYDQDFAFIRRQLNTDPRERETVAMGTQMTKIALTSLKKNHLYTRADGSPVRGRDLLKNIMEAINMLSNIGKEKIESEFFTDGELDLEKFSAFLENELESRDADANLLDGIEVVEEDGVQRFKVPLEAMSSIDWIQSIIVSKINKEVCDINVKGNAFYQRSVWGMEGKPKILNDKQVNFKLTNINNGEDLKLVNEDGSMDAVISIDFFEDIIPEGLKGNFKASRQWLIEHDIISGTKKDGTRNNAKANTIASRIPTQAQSSISPLRFVDVLPVVRDTIILPREFTKLTGSDFDIDKLYLVRLGYRVSTKKEGDKFVDEVSTEFDKDKSSQNYYRNRLINDYLTLLKSHGKSSQTGEFENGDSMHISMRSVDGDTKLWTNVLDRVRGNRPVERHYAYKFGNIAFQVATKAAFMLGKFGIGPFALNNNSQILTQLYDVKFAKSTTHKNILDSLGCLDLSNPRDKQGKSILSWLSGGININVDVAKNPERVAESNLNAFTYNNIMLLLRSGMGERALLFNMQPIMFELARVYDDASGSYMVDISKSKSSRQRSAMRNFVIDSYKRGDSSSNGDIKFIKEMLMGYGNSDEENNITEEVLGSYAQALFGINAEGKYETSFSYIDPSTGDIVERQGCILEDVLTNKEALDSISKGFSFDNIQSNRPLYRVNVKDRTGATIQVDMTPKDVQLYTYFIQNALSKYSQKLSDLVNVCKIDTKKQGKSYVEQQAYKQKYDEVFDNADGVFEDEGLQKLQTESYIKTKTDNAIDLYERILGEFSIQASIPFKEAHDKIITKLNSSSQNKQLSKKVTQAILKWIKSQYFKNVKGFDDLFYGENSIQNRLVKLQNQIINDKTGKFSKFGDNGDITLGENGKITNPLLKALQPDIYEEKKGFLHPMFIKLENALLEDSDNADALERAWDELYRDTYHYTEDKDGTKHYYVKEFAEDLAIYAFLTSGDTQGTTKFFKFVPNPIRQAVLKRINSENNNNVDELSYSEYMFSIQNRFTTDNITLTDEDINEIIAQNWQDNDFVKEVKMTVRRKGKRIAVNTSFGTITQKSSQVVSYKKKSGKVGFKTETLVKTVNMYIGGVKKVKDGLKETIHRCNDDNYPPFIKVRRPGSTKYDPDNYLLYQFREAKPIDPEDVNSETYPIYELTTPPSVSIRAGSYEYELLDYGEVSAAYPEELSQTIKALRDETLTDDENADKSIVQFTEALNKMGVSLQDEELERLLALEFDERGFEYTDAQLKAALKWVKANLKPVEQEQKPGKKKTVKRVVEKSTDNTEEQSPDVEVDTEGLFDDDEDMEIDNSNKSTETTEPGEQQSLEDDDLSEDDFDPDALEICTGQMNK